MLSNEDQLTPRVHQPSSSVWMYGGYEAAAALSQLRHLGDTDPEPHLSRLSQVIPHFSNQVSHYIKWHLVLGGLGPRWGGTVSFPLHALH